MNTDPSPDGSGNVVEDLKEYLRVNGALYRLKAAEKGADVLSYLMIHLIVTVILLMILFFAGIALAVYISHISNNAVLGFIVVTGLYALAGIIVVLSKDGWLKNSITNRIIKILFRD